MVTPHLLRSPGELLLDAGWAALFGVLLFQACNRDSKEAEIVGPAEPAVEEVGRGPLTAATVPLPFFGTVSSPQTAFYVRQTGSSGASGSFEVLNSNSTAFALQASTNGSGTAFSGYTSGLGRAAYFSQGNAANTKPVVEVLTGGRGDAVFAWTIGRGRAGVFLIQNPSSQNFALEANTNGGAHAIFGFSNGTGGGALFQIARTNNTRPAVQAVTNGTGPGLQVDHNGSSGNLALFRANNANRIRFTQAGKGIFNGGTQTGGADVAEAFAVEGRASAYEPGDVLVISTRSDRTVEKAAEPYSTRVIGVYATKPGVLLTERGVDESLEGLVPVGVIGVIPTKVSTENGPIRRGDILVSGSRPGHAMRASPVVIQGVTLYPTGAILGKAMEEFREPGTGVIRVLVNVK